MHSVLEWENLHSRRRRKARSSTSAPILRRTCTASPLGQCNGVPSPHPQDGHKPKTPPRSRARPPAAANTAHSPRADGDLHRHDLPGTCRGRDVALAPLAARRRRALRLRQREPYTSYYCYILAVASSQRMMMTTRIVVVAACRSCVAPYGGARRPTR